MKVLVCLDSFKGTASARDASNTIAEVLRGEGGVEVDVVPLRDGGEGFIDLLASGSEDNNTSTISPKISSTTVVGPWGAPVKAERVTLASSPGSSGDILGLEMAQAAGITTPVPPHLAPRNVCEATTFGVGQQLRLQLEANVSVSEVLVGLGGSATTDCGLGALQGFGFRVLVHGGAKLLEGKYICGSTLGSVLRVAPPMGFQGLNMKLCVDVTSPLFGETGSVRVFGPQKCEKNPETEGILDDLELMVVGAARAISEAGSMAGCCVCREKEKSCEVSSRGLPSCWVPHPTAPAGIFIPSPSVDVESIPSLGDTPSLDDGGVWNTPGCGAAGGLAFGLLCGFGARLERGFTVAAKAVSLPSRVAAADLVITGEGRLDRQSVMGKVVQQVGRLCEAVEGPTVPMVVVCGAAEGQLPGKRPWGHSKGLEYAFKELEALKHVVVLSEVFNVEECMKETLKCLREAVSGVEELTKNS